MFKRFLSWLASPFTAKSIPDEPDSDIKESPQRRGSMFSTDIDLKRKDLSEYVFGNMFQATHKDIKVVDRAGVAMDSSSVPAMDSTALKQAYGQNGTAIPASIYAWYVSQGFIGYQACAVIAQHWLVDKAITIPARDAVRNGYDITVNDGTGLDAEMLQKIRKTDKRYKLKRNLIELERFNRTFGIRIAIFKVKSNDKDYYEKPFNIDGVTKGSYQGISQVDPYWVMPELDEKAVSDPANIDFYEPTWWNISGKRYHKSHLVIVRYSEVADVYKPTYRYGGIPLPQMIYERVYAAERTANEGPQLAMTKRVNILRADVEKALANQQNFEERMSVFNHLRDNYGIFVIGKEEEYQQSETNLADLDDTIMTQYQLVAAIARVPAVKILETSPKGFNATGEYEQDSYNETLETIQDDTYTPLLDRHYQLVMKSEFPEDGKGADIEIVWNPVDSPDAKEEAEVNESEARTAQIYMTEGVVSSEEVRNKLIADENSGWNGLKVTDIDDDDEDAKEFSEAVEKYLEQENGEETPDK